MAVYSCKNEHNHFEYHDALVRHFSFENNTLLMTLDNLNVTKDNSQNSLGTDMSVKNAYLKFEDVRIIQMVVPEFYIGTNNEPIKHEEQIIPENRYYDIFKFINNEINYTDILEVNSEIKEDINNLSILFNFCTFFEEDISMVIFEFEFSDSYIEWDKYYKEAWYVRLNKDKK